MSVPSRCQRSKARSEHHEVVSVQIAASIAFFSRFSPEEF